MDDHDQNTAPASSRGKQTLAEGPRVGSSPAHGKPGAQPRSTAPWRMGQGAGNERPSGAAPRKPVVPDAAKQPSQRYVGGTVDGRYVVERLLSRGGMGAVYLCRRTVIDKMVAMKVLRPEFMHDAETTERFIIEAKAASAIGSPHIVEVFDFGTMPDGCTYFVMEFLDGDSLATVLHREGRLAPARVIAIAKQIAEGLAAAHDVDIVHRDLKPDNVVLLDRARTEFVKILDFGLAKMARGQGRLTRVGKVFGTPHYMSPEQARGKPVDRRSDVYALGIIMYEMLTGHVPFDGDTPMSILSGHVHGDVPPMHAPDSEQPSMSSDLEAVVLKCLSKQPGLRYANMRALAGDLDLVAQGRTPLARIVESPVIEIEPSVEVEALLAAVDDWEETEHVLIDADEEAESTEVDDHPLPKTSDAEVDEESEATVVDSSVPFPVSVPPPVSRETSDSGLELLPSPDPRKLDEPRIFSEPPDSLPSDEGWDPDTEFSTAEADPGPVPSTERRTSSSSLWPLAIGVVLLLGLVTALAWLVARERSSQMPETMRKSATPSQSVAAPLSPAVASGAPMEAPMAAQGSAAAQSLTAGSTTTPSVAESSSPTGQVDSASAPTPSSSAAATSTRRVLLEFVPPDAEVFVNGTSVGSAPVTVEVTRGRPVKIEAKREGYWRSLFWIDTSKPRVRMVMPPISAKPRPKPAQSAAPEDADEDAGGALSAP